MGECGGRRSFVEPALPVDGVVGRYVTLANRLALDCVAHGGIYWMMLPVVLKNIDRGLIARFGFEYTACIGID